ncbi:MAG: TIGR01777 family oxidoreductase [Bryobacteraceae bacterium]
MHITLTGATGFVGERLLARLQADGHTLRLLARKAHAAIPTTIWDSSKAVPAEALVAADAVIHLAGEPIAQRWNEAAKARIRNSRVEGTRQIVDAIGRMDKKPAVLISASAIGYYGSRGDEVLTESSKPGDGFLPEICIEWEREAVRAEAMGVRVVLPRIGVVLGKGGGAMAKMLPPFKAGVGGTLGPGTQWMAWIHLDDLVGLLAFALDTPAIKGPMNATSPNPAQNTEFTRQLAKAIHRPALFPVPEFVLKLLFGEMASVVLGSQRVLPAAAEKAGYVFAHPHLADALELVVS